MWGGVARAHDAHMFRVTWSALLASSVVVSTVLAGCGSDVAEGAPATPVPSMVSRAESSVELRYDDVTGASRVVRAELRLPDATVDGELPVVVWSHGGSRGFRRTEHVGARWGRAFNEAGFAFVAVAHSPRVDADRPVLCEAIGAADCPTFRPLSWDRPHDLAEVLDWIESIAPAEGLDPDRVVVAGHSAGAMGALHFVGMGWTSQTQHRPAIDDRPVAVIAASSPGADARGLDAADFDAVDTPMLFLSGTGDTTTGTDAEDRRRAFELLPSASPAALMWVDRTEARHGSFNLDTRACERSGGSATGCRRLARLIATAATDFATGAVIEERFDPAQWVTERVDRAPTWVNLAAPAS